MKVKDLMTADVKSCTAETDLATAAKIMWDCDCGIVPVVDNQRKVIGMITDRDICIAAATRGTSPASVQVRDVMSGDVHACGPEDDVRAAMETMKNHRVRRLPVVDRQARLSGIVSLNDVVLRADCREGSAVAGETFLETMKSICAHAAESVPA